jgi:hypothetical protein
MSVPLRRHTLAYLLADCPPLRNESHCFVPTERDVRFYGRFEDRRGWQDRCPQSGRQSGWNIAVAIFQNRSPPAICCLLNSEFRDADALLNCISS